MKHDKTSWWRNSSKLVFGGFLAIAGYFLWTEHQAHITPYLIWILLGACLLMHGGHGHNHGSDAAVDKPGDEGGKLSRSRATQQELFL
ncbi:MAG: hypothetical protein ACI9KN_000735 [Gammaproteobacteria bacterium]|jgi:hypothetical protein